RGEIEPVGVFKAKAALTPVPFALRRIELDIHLFYVHTKNARQPSAPKGRVSVSQIARIDIAPA
ncbi:MAG: hypothetical protein ACK5PF_01245, partial [bacterium]